MFQKPAAAQFRPASLSDAAARLQATLPGPEAPLEERPAVLPQWSGSGRLEPLEELQGAQKTSVRLEPLEELGLSGQLELRGELSGAPGASDQPAPPKEPHPKKLREALLKGPQEAHPQEAHPRGSGQPAEFGGSANTLEDPYPDKAFYAAPFCR